MIVKSEIISPLDLGSSVQPSNMQLAEWTVSSQMINLKAAGSAEYVAELVEVELWLSGSSEPGAIKMQVILAVMALLTWDNVWSYHKRDSPSACFCFSTAR